METIKLLDLYCGAGGASMGYHQAGYDVTGVDINPQKNYPFEFVQADAIEYLKSQGHLYDIIHASPPCQKYSSITKTAKTQDNHPDLIQITRDNLKLIGKPYIIENVVGARKQMDNPIMLCGTMFGLLVVRHRLFETSPSVTFFNLKCSHERPVIKAGRQPDHAVHYHSVVGHFPDIPFAKQAMGIQWMQHGYELAEAIPPAYTHWIGQQMMRLCFSNHKDTPNV